MSKIQVLLVEWMGYPLFRKKALGKNIIRCGLGNLLSDLNKYDAGIDFECSVVVNRHQTQPNRLVAAADRIPLLKPLLLNNPQTNCQQKLDDFLSKYSFIKQVFYRDNISQDIGAYDYFYQYLRQQKHDGHVLFINSSVRGPREDGWLVKYKNLFEAEPDTGLCGISLNSHHDEEFHPHVQSFFLYSSMSVLERVFPYGFLNGESLSNKDDLIVKGELEISAKVLKAGYGIRSSTFPDFFYKRGQAWTIPEGDIRFQERYASKANLMLTPVIQAAKKPRIPSIVK